MLGALTCHIEYDFPVDLLDTVSVEQTNRCMLVFEEPEYLLAYDLKIIGCPLFAHLDQIFLGNIYESHSRGTFNHFAHRLSVLQGHKVDLLRLDTELDLVLEADKHQLK